MSDVEIPRAHEEAPEEQAPRALRSARRAQLWAGFNRYLASEVVRASRTEGPDQKEQRKQPHPQ